MSATHQNSIEGINPDSIYAMTHTARDKTWQAIEDIRALLKPGMLESEAIKLANQYMASKGVKKFWHQTHIRFGANTVLSFNDPYTNPIPLKENDILYLDIGPVWDNIEGDCGKTFVLGDNPGHHKIVADVKKVFDETAVAWRAQNLSGQDLFAYANRVAQKMGYLLHPTYVKGHRLSEFSHKIYSKTNLFDTDFTPAPESWILEVQICDKDLQYGAFYEDILM